MSLFWDTQTWDNELTWTHAFRRREKGVCSSDDLEKMTKRAANWYCCSIGEKLQLPEVTKRDPHRAHEAMGDSIYKVSPELLKLGHMFGKAVAAGHFNKARKIHLETQKLLTPEMCEQIIKVYIQRRRESRYNFFRLQQYYVGTPFEEKEHIL